MELRYFWVILRNKYYSTYENTAYFGSGTDALGFRHGIGHRHNAQQRRKRDCGLLLSCQRGADGLCGVHARRNPLRRTYRRRQENSTQRDSKRQRNRRPFRHRPYPRNSAARLRGFHCQPRRLQAAGMAQSAEHIPPLVFGRTLCLRAAFAPAQAAVENSLPPASAAVLPRLANGGFRG